MSACGCNAPSSAPCACDDPVGNVHGAALSIGGSIGSFMARVAGALSIGPSASTHARNEVCARFGLPYVGRDGNAYSASTGAAGIAVGFGLELTPSTPIGRSASWRMCPLEVRSPAADSEIGGWSSNG